MSDNEPKKIPAWKLLLAGGVTGVINGFFGGGGGIAAVAALKRVGFETKKAHAGAPAAILPLCIVSGIVYIVKGSVSITEVLPYVPGGIVGALIGTALLKKLKPRIITAIFSLILIILGGRLLLHG